MSLKQVPARKLALGCNHFFPSSFAFSQAEASREFKKFIIVILKY